MLVRSVGRRDGQVEAGRGGMGSAGDNTGAVSELVPASAHESVYDWALVGQTLYWSNDWKDNGVRGCALPVTRAALKHGLQGNVLGVVHTVLPAVGAVVAYRRFFTGARKDFGDSPGPLNDIMGGNRVQYAIMQTRLRGPTELLPSNSYPDPFFHLGAGITNKFVDVYQEYPKQASWPDPPN